MKGEVRIDVVGQTVALSIVLERREDGGEAMEWVRRAARACWPDIAFNDEEGFEEDAPVAGVSPQARLPMFGFVSEPKPGSRGAEVRAFCLAERTLDFVRVADRFDIRTGPAACLIKRLQRSGYLPESFEINGSAPAVA